MDGTRRDTHTQPEVEPDEGMALTNGETYSTRVYLGVNDSPESWWEVPEADMPETTEDET